MDDRVRDLERIREDGPTAAGPRALSLLGGAAIVGLMLAVAVVMGRAAAPKAGAEDPLVTLPPLALQSPPEATGDRSRAPFRVDVSDLSFPKVLADVEDRPEVVASLKAAAAEEAALERDARKDGDPGSARVRSDSARLPDAIAPQAMLARVPAALAAASAGRELRRSTVQDPLLAAAMGGHSPKGAPAAEGRPGPYTLHVISYDRVELARSFASGLRARGHTAFVIPADVPERGRSYRVRIGPFQTREQAELYRRKFEDQEHMNTVVLRETQAAE